MNVPRVIAGANALEPLYQGDLSQLCGLYSILNAIQLKLYPERLTPDHRQRLFTEGAAFLGRERKLKRALCVGIEEDVWPQLGRAIFAAVADQFGVKFRLRRILKGPARSNRARAFQAIAATIDRQHPVLVCMDGELDHYTVICGYSPQRLRLFDSLGLRWLAIDGISVGEDCRHRHWMSPASTFAVVRAR